MAKRRWGSVQKRNGRWCAVYRPHKGATISKWERVYPNTSTRAEEVLAQRRSEIASGTYDDPHRKLTFGSLANEWFDTMSKSWRAGTIELRKINLERNILPTLNDEDVRRVDGPALQRLVNGLSGKSPRTVRLIAQQVRQILRWGHRHGRVRVLPDLTVSYPTLSNKRIDPFTHAEVRALLAHAFEHRTLLYWAVMTGMRQGEILAAKWAHLADGTYHVCESLQRTMVISQPKTGDTGDVWVPPGLMAALADQRAQVAAWRLSSDDWTDHGLIFPGRHGEPMQHGVARRALERTCKAAGIPPRSFHTLRHTCASLLLDQGESVVMVARQLRHRDPSITLRTYSHLLPDRGGEAVEKMERSIGA